MLRRVPLACLLALLPAAPPAPAGETEGLALHVTPAGPLASPLAARDAVRAWRAGGGTGAARVLLHDGRYRLASTLELTPEDSHVTWAAAEGERPVLTGSVPVAGWRLRREGALAVWAADVRALVPPGRAPRALFVDGERRPRPRLPKTGYWRIESVPGRPLGADHWKTLFDGGDAFVAAPATVAGWTALGDVEAVVLHFWIEERLALASFDPASRLVRTARKSLMALVDEAGDAYPRYFVENVREALAPGEWYFDRTKGELLYAPRAGETPQRTRVELPVLDTLLVVAGAPDRPVEAVRFEGVSFEQSAVPEAEPAVQAAVSVPGAIVLRHARGVAIEDGRLAGLGGYGVEIGEGCRDVRVAGSELVDLGAGGVKVDGSDAAGAAAGRTSGVRITDDSIHAIGRVFPSAVGVLVRHASDVEIAHDAIYDTYYTAISAGWVWGYAPSVTNAIRIVKNDIHDIGQGVLSDMGGVYTLGIQPGSVVRGNHVRDVRAAGYGGWAIYPDEGSSHIVIEDNVAHDTTGHVFHQHYGNENVVRNNVFAFGREGVVAISRGPAWNGGRGRLALTLSGNVLVADRVPLVAAGLSGDAEAYAAARRFDSDLNVLWDASGEPPRLGDGQGAGRGGLRKSYAFAEWQALGLDRHSVVADPGFVDAARRDLRLRPDSPALALGFRPIDLADVGPRPKERR
ncbi:MAG: right-handed parallel beta-helix repeat-containing protein [Vicinamibacteria bacterium]